MADLNAIYAGIATRLETVTVLNVSEEHPDQILPPHAVVGLPDTIDYHYTVGTTGITATIPIFLYVARVAVREGQKTLRKFLSTGVTDSIIDAIKGDYTLGATVDSAAIIQVRDTGAYTVGGNEYLGAEIVLEVIAGA